MDSETLEYYNLNAQQYFARTINVDLSLSKNKFLINIVPGGSILDFGCGSGRDSKAFIDAGYNVVSWDGSAELAKVASNYIGQEVICKDFRELDMVDTFDGIWASASLLHLSNEDLIVVLKIMSRALKDCGCICASFKNGIGESNVGGRYINYMNLNKMLTNLELVSDLKLKRYWVDDDNLDRLNVKWENYILKKAK